MSTTKNTESAPVKSQDDQICDRIMAAFEGQTYLNDADLLKASGVGRDKYTDIRDYLIDETNELMEFTPDAEDDAQVLYGAVRPMAKAKE
jgi:hypothetical protein